MAVTLPVVGAGGRGERYARLPPPWGARIVAVAEPRAAAREQAAAEFGMAVGAVFDDWRAPPDAGRLADAVVIATQDAQHADPAVALAAAGYAILPKKPMAPAENDSRRIADAAAQAGVLLAVCHVLRYTPYARQCSPPPTACGSPHR